MNKFYLYIVFILNIGFTFLSKPAISQSWTVQTSGVTSSLFAISFSSANIGGVVGSNANNNSSILTTQNGGVTWTKHNIGGTFYGIHFFSDQLAWAVGFNGLIFHTSNGGLTWQSQVSGVTKTLSNVYFITPNKGWAFGQGGIFLETINGGINWSPKSLPNNPSDLDDMFFINQTIGWLVGYGDKIYKTNDQGLTWTLQTAIGNFNCVHFIDDQNGWAGGRSGKIVKTNDGGVTWSSLPKLYSGSIVNIQFLNLTDGWMTVIIPSGQSVETIQYTTDGGISWNPVNTPIGCEVSGLSFINSTTGWACGSNGSIFKYSAPVGLNIIVPNSKFSVYPNPVSNQLKIEGLTLGEEIIITDILGEIIYKSIASNTETTIDNLTTNGNLILSIKNKEQKVIYHKVILSINN